MFHLLVLTPVQTTFEGEVLSVIAPGIDGYLEILTNHAPIVTSLQPGKLVITDRNQNKLTYAVSGGFLEVYQNEATLLADAIEAVADIDLRRAERSLDRGYQRLQSHSNEIDKQRAKSSIKRAENRIKLYREFQNSHS